MNVNMNTNTNYCSIPLLSIKNTGLIIILPVVFDSTNIAVVVSHTLFSPLAACQRTTHLFSISDDTPIVRARFLSALASSIDARSFSI